MLKKILLGKKNRGSALVVTLFVLAIILISALSITLVALKERKASIGSSGSNRAYQSSDEGIEKVMQAITRGNYATVGDMITGAGFNCSMSGTITGTGYEVGLLDIANAQIACSNSSTALVSSIVRIKSIGISSGTKRAMEALVSNGKKTILLMHFNSLDGSSNFEDSSYYSDEYKITNTGTTSTNSGGAILDSTNYADFPVSGNYFEIKDNDSENNFNLSNKDFTIEMWIKIGSHIHDDVHILSQKNFSTDHEGFDLIYDASGSSLKFRYYNDSGALRIANPGSSGSGAGWHHIAVSKKISGSAGKMYFFIDGKYLGSSNINVSDIKIKDSSSALVVGLDPTGSNDNLIGNIDELRITKGIARWTDIDQNGTDPGIFTPWDIEYAPND